MNKGVTIFEAVRRWAREGMNPFPTDMIAKLIENDPDKWHEITYPLQGDRVYVYDLGETGNILREKGSSFEVEMDSGEIVEVGADELEVERDTFLPMWETMWQFDDFADENWLTKKDGIRAMAECGFRVYESDEFGCFFGIDGAGYDFYLEHWIPLYKARGLNWHDKDLYLGGY